MADSIGQTIACCEELNTAYGGIDITNLDSVAAGDAVQGTGGFTNMSAADYISPEQEFSDPVSTGMPTFTPQEPIEPVEPVDITPLEKTPDLWWGSLDIVEKQQIMDMMTDLFFDGKKIKPIQ